MSEPLHEKYRPGKWDDVIGHEPMVRSLRSIVSKKEAQTFLFSGGSGVGKTTLARIAAREFGCERHAITELDAATHTGIDEMRAVQTLTQYIPLGQSKARSIIIDECHRLSSNAWDSLLKATEKPPANVYWFFCTTNIAKVPATIKTRSIHYDLKPVPDNLLGELYDDVCDREKIKLDGDIGDLIIREAKGSPRQLLVNLASCRVAKDKKEAVQLLKTAVETDPIIELCRFLSNGAGGSWTKAMAIVKKLEEENPEGVRIVVMNYMGSALRKANSDRDATYFLQRLEAFAVPYNTAEGLSPLLRSIGQVMFSGE